MLTTLDRRPSQTNSPLVSLNTPCSERFHPVSQCALLSKNQASLLRFPNTRHLALPASLPHAHTRHSPTLPPFPQQVLLCSIQTLLTFPSVGNLSGQLLLTFFLPSLNHGFMQWGWLNQKYWFSIVACTLVFTVFPIRSWAHRGLSNWRVFAATIWSVFRPLKKWCVLSYLLNIHIDSRDSSV